jgi:hypothetical protein
MKPRCSEKERKLMIAHGMEYLLDNVAIDPITLYRMAMRNAFLNNKGGKADESLRNCIRAIDNGKPFRMTPEWDALIDL